MKRAVSLGVLLMLLAGSAGAAPFALQVADARLGKGVENREIVGETSTFAVGDRVYLWLKVTGGPSDPIKVNWTIGNYTDTVSLAIGGDPWRTWSDKGAFKAGSWTVTVTDAAGTTLKDLAFTVK